MCVCFLVRCYYVECTDFTYDSIKILRYKLLLGYSNMVNSCSVYGCKSNYKTTGNGNYVSVFKFPDNTTKQTEWFRKLPNKDFQITKTSRVCIKHF